jgi:putative PIN family toxin of toxin-antitoxin system
MRVVFDTNITISGLMWSGAPAQAMTAAMAGQFTLVSSEPLAAELRDVLSRPKFASRLETIGRTVEAFLANYQALVEMVEAAAIEPVIRDDPDDDAVLACAVGGGADYIVSGDRHLLDLGSYAGIQILDVSRFLEVVADQ